MFNAIRRILSKNEGASLASPPASNIAPEWPIETYFMKELQDCKYIKPECHAVVLKHLKHELSLTKTGNSLTAEEKKSRGINPRLAITKELIEVLSDDGLALDNPKAILEELYNKASITKARTDGFQKAVRLGVKKYTLNACGDGSECAWCAEHSGKQFGPDILQQMEVKCTCTPYSKCFITPIMEF
jgi:hypothetical protein